MVPAPISDAAFNEAVEKLSSLIHRADSEPNPNAMRTWASNFETTFKHLKILELEEPLERLGVIHVAGTKGKGSTCAFCERILRESGFKTGLFTSPHLLDVRERFRFDGEEVSKDLFVESFWFVYNRLRENEHIAPLPGFFRFTFLLALKMFTSQKVDVAILEVGLGGRLDATNAVEVPVVTGISSLGLDHCELLGNTIDLIAREKAGIFKATVPAFTSPQLDEAMKVLKDRAEELQIPLTVAPPLESYGIPNLQLGLRGDHQRMNASLAVALCKTWAERTGNLAHWHTAKEGGLPESYVRGLAKTCWPGRCEIVEDNVAIHDEEPSLRSTQFKFGRLQFFLDGAHSPESMEACGKWFSEAAKLEERPKDMKDRVSNQGLQAEDDGRFRRVLLFGCMPRRDPMALLPPLVNQFSQHGMSVDLAVFAPQSSSYVSISPAQVATKTDLSWQMKLQSFWETIRKSKLEADLNGPTTAPGTGTKDLLSTLEENKGGCRSIGPSSAVMVSLPATLEWLRVCAKQHPKLHIQVLVTGSLYMVGDMLRLLRH
ncbi:hypothetical protein R1sor_003776 [Riccia sorocarpa]|uniref:Folylpolyglutamate synthase n=1 Tax=Riccia sorocarpa TaxID=122646 RepID=A0ABD3H5F3_9MARC